MVAGKIKQKPTQQKRIQEIAYLGVAKFQPMRKTLLMREGTICGFGVLRLCSVSMVKESQSENAVFSLARTRCMETLFSLFPIYSRLPKLDVAGSSPVSRSKINITETLKTHPLSPSIKNHADFFRARITLVR